MEGGYARHVVMKSDNPLLFCWSVIRGLCAHPMSILKAFECGLGNLTERQW